jgi:alanine-synthesizing transaminase
MADGEACKLPMPDAATFLDELRKLYRTSAKTPKVILISFPHNPTTVCVDLDFMKEVVALAREYGSYVIHDFAYAELGFDGYKPPSILQVEGAADHCIEIYSMTKSYNMAGWRVGFCLGNAKLISALARIKSYLDYGIFQPIQIASIIALRECDDAPRQICSIYQNRRDVLCEGLNRAGWAVVPPKASMFVWTRIPEPFSRMPSLEFAKLLMKEAHVAVSPGIGFGPMGEGYVRFSLIENNHRTRQATKSIQHFLQGQTMLTGTRAVNI